MLPNILKVLQDSDDAIAIRTLSTELREESKLSPEEFKTHFQRAMDEGVNCGLISCRDSFAKALLNFRNPSEPTNLRAQLMLLTEEMQEQQPQDSTSFGGEPSDVLGNRPTPARISSRLRNGSGGRQRPVAVPVPVTMAANKRSRSGSHSRGRRHTASSPPARSTSRGRRRSRSRRGAAPPAARRRSRSRRSRSRSQRRR